MGSGAVIYLPSFIKIGSGIQKLIGGGIHTRTATRSHKHTLFFQNKESRIKITCGVMDHYHWYSFSLKYPQFLV
jgi:hypothetical protein